MAVRAKEENQWEIGTARRKYKYFDGKEFMNNLLTKGSCVACDESSKSFNNHGLPEYYDEEMFKRGQAFFHKHIFGMFLGNFLGLICGLAIKSSLAILILTNMSSSDYTAYKRYVATILHMMIWYDSEFRPGSRLWESIKDVKSKHNSASKKSQNVLKYRINQKDMALTQFGFMGFAMTRSKMLGIHERNDEDLKCFIHVWRVIGYVLGIEDEFNICRESVDETKAICDEIITLVLKPEVEKRDPEHKKMCSYLVNGLWAINPFLNLNTFMFYMEAVLNNSLSSVNNTNPDYKKLTINEKLRLHIVIFVTAIMRFNICRESVDETKAICDEIITLVLKPEVEKRDPEHKKMCSYLVNGLWAINPFLNLNTFMFYMEAVLNNSLSSVNNTNPDYKKLTINEKLRLHIVIFVTAIMRFTVIRVILKYLQLHSLWIAKTSPYLAYYKYGKKNSHVNVMGVN